MLSAERLGQYRDAAQDDTIGEYGLLQIHRDDLASMINEITARREASRFTLDRIRIVRRHINSAIESADADRLRSLLNQAGDILLAMELS